MQLLVGDFCLKLTLSGRCVAQRLRRPPHVEATVLNAGVPGSSPASGRHFLHVIPPLSASPFPVYLYCAIK